MATMPMTTFAELERLGKWIAGCGETFQCPTEGHGLMIALECYATGMTPFAWLRRYGLLHGRPSMKADAMLADFQARGGKWKIIERSAKRAAMVFTYEGQETPFEFTLEQAVKAGYTMNEKKGTPNKQWATIPENMLFARCVSGGLRLVCPMIVAGYYTPEELNDEGEEQTQAAPVELPAAVAKVTQVAKAAPVPAPAPAAAAPVAVAAGKGEAGNGKGQAVATSAAPVKAEVAIPASGPIPADATVPAELQPAAPTAPVAVDYSLCPIGTAATKGKPWRELADVHLKRCLTAKDGVFAAVTTEHRAMIEEELARRADAKAKEAPAQA